MTGSAVRDDVALVADAGRRARDAQRVFDSIAVAERARLLTALADAVERARPELVELAIGESRLPKARLDGEVARAAGQFRLMADLVADGGFLDATIDPADSTAVPPRPDLRRSHTAIGPVAVYAASNFPFAFGAAGTDTSSALAAGCAVVVKAHPLQPRTADASIAVLRQSLHAQGAPADLVQVVHGMDAGRELIRCAEIRAGAFTGSTAGGRALFDLAGGRPDPIPFYGELGSVNPVLFTPAAVAEHPERLAEEFAGSITFSSGQLCTRPSLLLVPAGPDGERFEQLLASALAAAAPAPMLSSVMAENFTAATDALVGHAGVRALVRGADAGGAPGAVLGTVQAATVLADPMPYLHELFGPFALVVRYLDVAQLGALMDILPGSLTFTLRGTADDPDLTSEIVAAARRRAGRLLCGGVPTGVSVTRAQMHGGTWPAATSSTHSSVGELAIRRFLRPVAYQDMPQRLLPPELRDHNPGGVARRVNGVRSTGSLTSAVTA
ncbi:aldehyde dehydrogenase family protein [Dactylosporangium sp. CA-233914]|uniref:aldehyde dehydrogenase family protein n=1 Tax=Dactylosporangium sp. CA-233914 TaxID=3239934 RepID=UPI003D8AFB83